MDKIFRTTRMLRFGDCDPAGIAYFPAYLNILNGVQEDFWTHIGFPWRTVTKEEGWTTPTVHLSCDFSRPSFHGDELEFAMTVTKVGRTSMTAHHDITCGGSPRWSSTQVLVATDLEKQRAIAWPSAVREKLLTLLVEEDGSGGG